MKIIFEIFVIILCPMILLSQLINNHIPSEKLTFEHIDEEDGLSSNKITFMLQDSKGFMWIGTKKGLNKYNGYNFKVYSKDSELNNVINENNITAIFEDNNKNLWIGAHGNAIKGMYKGHLYKYIRERDTFKHYSIKGKVISIDELDSGNLLIANQSGFYVFNINSGKFDHKRYDRINKHYNYSRMNKILVTNINNKEEIWFGNTNGLYKTNTDFDKIDAADEVMQIFKRQRASVISLYEDDNNILWIGTQSAGLIKYEINKNKIEHFEYRENNLNSLSYNKVQSILRDKSGVVWVGTKKGLNKYDPEKKQFIRYFYDKSNPYSMSDSDVTFIFEDNSGVIWIGTSKGGLNKINKQTNQFTHYNSNPLLSTSLASNLIRTLHQDKQGNVWIGTNNKGLDKFDIVNEKFYHFNKKSNSRYRINNNIIRDIEEDNKNNIWVGTSGGGLNKLNLLSGKISYFKHIKGKSNCLVHNSIRTIYKDNNGIFWIGTNGGLNRFDPDNQKFKQFVHDPNDPTSISSNRIESILEINNKLWIGTQRGGINVFDPKAEKFISYKQEKGNTNSLSNNNVWFIYNDKNNAVWVSTLGGLNRFNENENNFTQFQFNKDSIANDVTKVIVEDQLGNFWVGNNSGLFKLNREKDRFINYTKKYNIPDIAIDAIMEDDSGYLWIYGDKYIIKANTYTDSTNVFKLKNSLESHDRFKNSFIKCADGQFIISGLNGFLYFNPNAILNNNNIPNTVLSDFKIFNKSVDIFENEREDVKKYIFLNKHISETEVIKIPYDMNVFSIEFAALDYRDPMKNKYLYKLDGVDPDWVETDASRRFATYNQLNPGEYTFFVKGSNNDGVWNEEARSLKIIITPLWWQTTVFKFIILSIIIGFLVWLYFNRINALKKKHRLQAEFSRRLVESQEMDRKRIATALHDGHGQNLLVISNEMQYFTKEHKEYKQILNPVTKIVQESIDEIRNIAYTLHPHQLDKLGLTKTIKSMIQKVSGSSDIHFTSRIDEIDDLFEKNIEINIYRILQEAVNNIVRHSEATESEISIDKNIDLIEIMVNDNGKGFKVEEKLQTAKGLGLSGIYERVNLIRGEIKINSQPKNGTNIIIKIPIKSK